MAPTPIRSRIIFFSDPDPFNFRPDPEPVNLKPDPQLWIQVVNLVKQLPVDGGQIKTLGNQLKGIQTQSCAADPSHFQRDPDPTRDISIGPA